MFTYLSMALSNLLESNLLDEFGWTVWRLCDQLSISSRHGLFRVAPQTSVHPLLITLSRVVIRHPGYGTILQPDVLNVSSGISESKDRAKHREHGSPATIRFRVQGLACWFHLHKIIPTRPTRLGRLRTWKCRQEVHTLLVARLGGGAHVWNPTHLSGTVGGADATHLSWGW